jgi:flavin-binding protein dodecin
MAESPRRVDLRLTIPARSPFRELAIEVAVKFAEYVGASQASVHAAVEHALARTTGDHVDIEMASDGRKLVVTTSSGSGQAIFPLSD